MCTIHALYLPCYNTLHQCTKNNHSSNKSLRGHVNVKEWSKHSMCWWVVNCNVSTELCWERSAEMSILPLWQHVHLLCSSGIRSFWLTRGGTSGSTPRLLPHWGGGWRWGDRRTPKGCVCRRRIGATSSALQGPVICPPCLPLRGPQNAEQQETSTPEQTGPAVHPLLNNTTTNPTMARAPLNICNNKHVLETSWLMLQYRYSYTVYNL